MELEWLEAKAQKMREFVDSKPITELEDRMAYKETRGGGVMPMIVATIEAQHKDLRETLKDYAILMDAINKLREGEEKKKLTARGDVSLSPMEEGDI